ncbi:MAG: hypothetical protein HY064_05065 [Bacteroidetes bacterium]|nr:hypothetical protein [Bacteroidota bacterium]
MKKFAVPFLFSFIAALGIFSCSGDKPNDATHNDSVGDTSSDIGNVPDSVKQKFRKLVAALPVPFEVLNRFSGAHLPYHGELLNPPDNADRYNGGNIEAVNLGIYGADIAYMISQNNLGESAPYMKSIRRLSDEIVIPTAFDEMIMKRYGDNKDSKDSMQSIITDSYHRIDNTLQSNDRLTLATLVICGGWIESIYLTTQHIGTEQQNEKNKVLFDMLTMQQPYIEKIDDLLSSFPNDSTCAMIYRDMKSMQDVFPSSEMSPEIFSAQLQKLDAIIAKDRNQLVKVQ